MSKVISEIINRGLEDRISRNEQDTLTKEFSKLSSLTGSFAGMLTGGGGGGGRIVNGTLGDGWKIDIDGIHSDDDQVHIVSFPHPYISLGATDYQVGSGVWMGRVADEYVFYVGSADGDAMTWDGTDLAITGDIIADGGSIGGSEIGADYIQSSNYSSGIAGWHINNDGYAEFGNVRVRGSFYSAVFEVNEIAATAGTFGVFWKASTLERNLNLALDPGSNYVYIKNDITVSSKFDTCSFDAGDIVRIRGINTAGIAKQAWITLGTKTPGSDYAYFEYTENSGNTGAHYLAGNAVIGYNPAGGASIYLTADGAIGSEGNISIATHGATPWTGETLKVRLGNMDGSFGATTDRYGIGIGDYSGGNGNYISYNAQAADKFILKAGGGKVILDEDGIRLNVGLYQEEARSVSFYYDDAVIAYLGVAKPESNATEVRLESAGPQGDDSWMVIEAISPSSGDAAIAYITARNDYDGDSDSQLVLCSDGFGSVSLGSFYIGATSGWNPNGDGDFGVQNDAFVRMGLVVGSHDVSTYSPGQGEIIATGDIAFGGALRMGTTTPGGTNGWIYSYGAQQGWIASAVAGDYSCRWYASAANRWYTPDNVAIGAGLHVGSNTAPVTDTITMDSDIYRTAFQAYTPSYVGWAATPTRACAYKRVGKLIYCKIEVTGTSNSGTTTVALPVQASSVAGNIYIVNRFVNTGTAGLGIAHIGASGTNAVFYTGAGGTGWTASGTKSVWLNFVYEAIS